MSENRPDQQELKYNEPLDDDEVLRYFWACRSASEEAYAPVLERNRALYDAYWDGHGLSEKDLLWLKETNRILANFNFAQGTVNAIVGADQADRKEVQYRPFGKEPFDQAVAGWATDLNRWSMNQCNGYRHESDAYLDQLIGGYGFLEIFLNTSVYPMRVDTARVQPWEMLPDPDAMEDNLEDSTYFIRERAWNVEQVQARWPEKAEELETSARSGGIPTIMPSASSRGGAWRTTAAPYHRRNKILVWDFVYRRYLTKVVWVEPKTGERKNTLQHELDERNAELTAEAQEMVTAYEGQIAQLQQQAAMDPMAAAQMAPPPAPELPEPIVPDYTYAGECIYRAYIVGNTSGGKGGILLEHKKLDITGFPYKAITGFKHKMPTEGRVRYFGMMGVIADAQKYINKTMSSYIDVIGRSAKGGWWVPKGAVPNGNFDKFMKDASIPGLSQIVEDGYIDQIKEKGVGQSMHNFDSFLELLISMMSQISAVTEYVKGTATQERSNVLISNFQAQSAVMLNPITDQLTQCRISSGKTRLEMMLKFMPDEVLNEIIGRVAEEESMDVLYEAIPGEEGQEETIQPRLDENGQPLTAASLMKQRDPLKFDVAVDIGQASPTSRQAFWMILTQQGVLKSILDPMVAAGMDVKPLIKYLLKMMPLPGTQALEMSNEIEEASEAQAMAQTAEGVKTALLESLPPEEAAAIVAEVSQQLGLGMAPPEGNEMPGAPPPPGLQ